MSDEIRRGTMQEPIERLFEREFPSQYGVVHIPKEGASVEEDVDILYVENASCLHAVRMENTYDACMFNVEGGLHTVQNVPANRHWIALPLDEFRSGEEMFNNRMEETCAKRGIGIICVQPKGRGLSAKSITDAVLTKGDFFDQYPELEDRWKDEIEDDIVAEGYTVVDYY